MGLVVSTFAQQKESSLSEQDRAQAAARRGGTMGGSLALKPIDQAALQAAVDATAEELLIPGAVLILSTPQGEFIVSYGTTTLGATIPPRADTHFRIASNTKTMTAAVIVQLAQEGRLDLDDPVSNYVSGVPNGDQITIAELLKMRSGLYNYTDAPEISASLDEDPTKVWTPEEVLTIAFKHPPTFPPGTAYQYSNTNYALLGLIAQEREHGEPLAKVFQDRLFGPLGMNETALPASTSNTLPDPCSRGYLYGSSSFALRDQPYPPDIQAASRAGTLKPNDDTSQNPSYASAAGGVISTANDLVTWMRALIGGKVFNADYQRRWLDSLQPEDPSKPHGQQYGYGIAQLRFGPNTVYFHGGEMPGYNSFMGYDPTNRVMLIVWTNLTISLDGNPTANSIMLKVLDQVYVDSPLRPTQTSTPP
jgi:D-alanyl-D-alanine carboxypeptidase